MDRAEFLDLLAECGSATSAYLREAEKTSVMLRKCTLHPLNFDDRFALLSQEILERDAYRLYLASKRSLHEAALLGYEALSAT
jgi:hypothetical protein